MSRSQRAEFLASIALAVGAILYIGGRPPTLQWFDWAEALGLASTVSLARDFVGPTLANLPAWALYSLPFALWVFAFTAVIRNDRWLPIAPALAIGAELGQSVGIVPGTFDPVDLALLALFTALGMLVRVSDRNSAGVVRPAAVSLVFVVLAAGTSESEEHKAEREAKEAKQEEGLLAYMKTMADVHAKLAGTDPAALPAKPCKSATIELGKEVLGLRTVSLEFLARFGDKSKWTENESGWKFIDDSTYAGHFSKHPDDREAYSRKDTAKRVEETFLHERYLIVLRPDAPDSLGLPELRKNGFIGGFFEGWMQVVDQTDGSITCQDHIVAESSETFDFGGMLDSDDPESEMLEDFEDNFEAAIEKALPKGIDISTGYGSLIR